MRPIAAWMTSTASSSTTARLRASHSAHHGAGDGGVDRVRVDVGDEHDVPAGPAGVEVAGVRAEPVVMVPSQTATHMATNVTVTTAAVSAGRVPG